MSDTTAAFAQSYAFEQSSRSKSEIVNEANKTEDIWNSDISTYSGYDINIVVPDGVVFLDDPYTIDQAVENARDTLASQGSFDDYDAILVFDDRTYNAAGKVSDLKCAGTDEAVGVLSDHYNQWDVVPSHELAHIYGGRHGTYEDSSDHSWQYDRYGDKNYTKSVIAPPDDSSWDDCYNDSNSMPFGLWYSGCTGSEARDCIDGGGDCNI